MPHNQKHKEADLRQLGQLQHQLELGEAPGWCDHNRDQQKKDSKKTSTAAIVEMKNIG